MSALKFTIALTLCTLFHFSYSQTGSDIEKGDKAFDDFDFESAIYFYSVAYDATPSDADITRKIANTHRRMGNTAESAEWYRKTIELDASKAEDMLYYAEALKNLSQYEDAIHWYEIYDKMNPGDSRAKSHLKDKFYYKDLFADTARYSMKKLKINNTSPIIGISLFEDNQILASGVNLAKDKTHEFSPYLDIYTCKLGGEGELLNPSKIEKKVNSKYHDGPMFYSFAEKKLYITRNNIKNGKPVRDKNGNVNLKLYAAEYQNGSWSSAQELKMNDDDYSTGHACISANGETMYFVSTRDGGYGGSDIYQCYKTTSGWSDPINLGSNINTAGNEMFPYMDERGYLYFASDGHAGLGGLDIFFSSKTNEVWGASINMGAPVNSAMDDFALVFDSEHDNGYFCSNRSGKGDDDIYSYRHVAIEKMVVAGTIHSKEPNITLAGEPVQIKLLNSGTSLVQFLDTNERFEFSASSGEKVEITMMNSEFFDPTQAILEYSIPEKITDPFINIGERNIAITFLPSKNADLSNTKRRPLSDFSKPSLAAATTEQENSSSSAGGSEKSMSTLNAVGYDAEHTLWDESQLVTRNGAFSKNDEAYLQKIKQADLLFNEKQFAESKAAYLNATSIKPGEKYPKERLAEIDNILKAETAGKASLNNANQTTSGVAISTKQQGKTNTSVASSSNKSAIPSTKSNAEKSNKNDIGKSLFETSAVAIDLTSLQIDHVIFEYNKATIRQEDTQKLDQLVSLLKSNPDMTLLIRAHCDSRGSLAYNQSLSMSRAMAVQGYLLQHGIGRNRMKAEWFGEQRPLNGCVDAVPCAEGEYEVNRRAEFKVTSEN